MSVAEKLVTIAENQEKVFDAGFENGKDIITTKAKTISFSDLNFGVPSITLNLDKITSMAGMFGVLGETSEITINCPNELTSVQGCFDANTYETKLKKLTLNINTQKTKEFNAFFWQRQGLEIIDGMPLSFMSATRIGSAFTGCYGLKEVRFAEESIKITLSLPHSSLLSDESIQSVVDGLGDLTGLTAQTLTLHATVGAKLTEEQKATITAKNWTLVY